MDVNALAETLRRSVGDDGVLTAAQVGERSAGTFRSDRLKAPLLVRPRAVAEVSAVLRACHQARAPVVTHGGLTGLVHGADAGADEIILSLERLRAIEEINPVDRTAVVQAGVTVQAIQEAAEAAGLMFPLDLGARGSATLGGTIATNAGGNRVVRYGMMRDMVLGLEAVLADGTIVSNLSRIIKNNTGYDLRHLFIGSEGTLGVVTRATLRLRERPASRDVAFAATRDFGGLVKLLKHMDHALGGRLSAFEVMWQSHYDLVTQPPAKSSPPLARGYPYYVLVESLGADPERDGETFLSALDGAHRQEIIADAAIAQSRAEGDAMWAIRDDVGQLRRFPSMQVFDISLPLSAIEGYVEKLLRHVAARWPHAHCFIFGHLGDGNLHVAVGSEDAVAGSIEADALCAMVYQPLASLGGSVSAEHGIGLEKKSWLYVSRSADEIAVMRSIKEALDPLYLLNPGKIFDIPATRHREAAA
ncbi:MAG TPA: FAD-binding oxidoreductase [Burkholderiales bacterium]